MKKRLLFLLFLGCGIPLSGWGQEAHDAALLPPPTPEIVLSPRPILPLETAPPAGPTLVTPPAPQPQIQIYLQPFLPAPPPPLPATETPHDEIGSLLEKNYLDPALFRSAGLKDWDKLPGVRLVPAVDPETHPPLQTNLLPGRLGHIGYWRARGLAAPHGGWARVASQLRNWNHGAPAEAVPGILLDLRGTTAPSDCAGAARIASFFMRPNQFLFSVDGPQTPLKSYRTEGGDETGTVYDGPLIVLIDAGTRGAAEALADALRRERNAILVGQPTAGEAALFSSFPISGQRVLVMPTAAIRRPNGQAFFGEPVAPDIAVNVTPEEEAGALKELDTTPPANVIAMSAAPAPVSETTLARDENPEVEAIRMQEKSKPEPAQPKDPILLQALDALKAIMAIPNPVAPVTK